MTIGSVIVMGVSGSGKSTLGAMLASHLGAKFIDGDDLHPRSNIEKMSRGEPLDDQDRAPWLERIRDVAFSLEKKNEFGIIVCSALRRAYRDTLRDGNQKVTFLFLDGEYGLILSRLIARQGHFMKTAMLDSQFATLERPSHDEVDVISISIDTDIEALVQHAANALNGKEVA
ncbi:gluconokinase [Salinivibrio sp. ES.052]|uniref:gluconokinase n=1 Tax=Salinivibrio sp. ES.052 TaxID=1882823 RepID=UPI000925D9CF|nr:gluconokinase [Salinivibrio sp. ES.052]SIO36360.1 gluconokinase [Salinivibrio sp. ES.052]